jgi:PAS domain S-box-containing protein
MARAAKKQAAGADSGDWQSEEAGQSWRLESAVRVPDGVAPFFPDQNSQVYERLLHIMPTMIHAMDAVGRVTVTNPEWNTRTGYSRQDSIGLSFPAILDPVSRNHLIRDVYPRVFHGHLCSNETLVLKPKGGGTLPVSFSMNAYRGDRGRIERFICLMQPNPPEPDSSEEDLEFKRNFEEVPYGLVFVAPNGEIAIANPAFRRLVQLRDRELEGVAFDELLDRNDRPKFLTELMRLMGGEVPEFRHRLVYRRGSGGSITAETVISLVLGRDKAIDHLTIVTSEERPIDG